MPFPSPPSHPCPVCQNAVNGRTRYCPRCGRILDHARVSLPVAMIIAALVEAYDSVADAFRCYYSDALLNTDSPRQPFYLVFDHVDPGGSRVVACARFINDMKKGLPEKEFRIIVPALSDHMELGTPFDTGVIDARRYARAAGRRRPVS